MITKVIGAYRQALAHAPIVVVTGYEHDLMHQAIQSMAIDKVHTTYNPHHHQGQYYSVYQGISHILNPKNHYDQATHVLISVSDIPLIQPETIQRIAKQSSTQPRSIHMPCMGNKTGHPVCFPLHTLNNLPTPSGFIDKGLKPLFANSMYPIHRIICNDPGMYLDVDTPDDLQAARIVKTSMQGNRQQSSHE